MESPLVTQLWSAGPFLLVGAVVTSALAKNQSKQRFLYALAAVFLLAAVKLVRNERQMMKMGS